MQKNSSSITQNKSISPKAKALKLNMMKKYKEAEVQWINALQEYADGDIYFNFGNTLFNLSKFESAGKAYILAIKLGYAQNYLAYYNAACAYSRLREKELGLEYLSQAIKNGYNAISHIKSDPDLKYLRKSIDIDEFISKHLPERHNSSLDIEFIDAVKNEDINKVIELLQKGANIDTFFTPSQVFAPVFVTEPVKSKQDIYGGTALHFSLRKGNFDIFTLLINKNANVNIQDGIGWTPLMLSIYMQNIPAIKALLSKGAKVQFQGNLGERPVSALSLLYLKKYHDEEIIKQVKKLSGNTDDPAAKRQMYINLNEEFIIAINNQNIPEIKKFLKQGADPNFILQECPCAPKYPPILLIACRANNFEIVKLLVESGSSVNPEYAYVGDTPLCEAIRNERIEIIKYLISKGARVNPNNESEQSPVEIAKKKNNAEIIKILKKAGGKF